MYKNLKKAVPATYKGVDGKDYENSQVSALNGQLKLIA